MHRVKNETEVSMTTGRTSNGALVLWATWAHTQWRPSHVGHLGTPAVAPKSLSAGFDVMRSFSAIPSCVFDLLWLMRILNSQLQIALPLDLRITVWRLGFDGRILITGDLDASVVASKCLPALFLGFRWCNVIRLSVFNAVSGTQLHIQGFWYHRKLYEVLDLKDK